MNTFLLNNYTMDELARKFYYLIPEEVKKVVKILIDKNKEVFIVGGAVRDFLMGFPVKDYDIATDAFPEEMIDWFKKEAIKVVTMGQEYGTLLVIVNKLAFDVSTYRNEIFDIPGKPPRVTYVNTLLEDLQRRDFQINSLAFDPVSQKIIDKLNILNDFNIRIIRTINNPKKVLLDDGLRLIRLARLMAQLEFEPESPLKETAMIIGSSIKFRNRKSLKIEFLKLIGLSNPVKGFKFLLETGSFSQIFPQLRIDTNNSFLYSDSFIENFKLLNQQQIWVRLFSLILFLQKFELEETTIENVSQNLDLNEKELKIMKRIYNSWINFPKPVHLFDLKRWIRSTGLVTSIELLKLIFLYAELINDSILLTNKEEILKQSFNLIKNMK